LSTLVLASDGRALNVVTNRAKNLIITVVEQFE
jgi:hypothetical protein